MRKLGYYAIYNNKEYSATMDFKTKEIILYSEDKSEKRNGFKRVWSVRGLYYKKVSAEFIQHAYHLHNYAIYKGKKMRIFGKEGDKLWLEAPNSESAIRAGIPRYDNAIYADLISIKDIDKIMEE